MLSILGPRRMPYNRLLALATGTAEGLSERLSSVEQS
jgi:transcriptional regulator of heat shock response